MWDPPSDTPSMSTTPSETTWRIWLVETLAKGHHSSGAREDDGYADDERSTAKLKDAA
jgi:hypothetical protein